MEKLRKSIYLGTAFKTVYLEFVRRIDFGEIEWKKENGDPVDKPLGQKWIGLDEVKERWGRLNPDGTKSHVFGKVEFDDIEEPVELLKATWEEYQKRCEPFVSYEGKVIDLKEIDDREHEGVGLGDVVTVIDKEFNPELRIKARVNIDNDLVGASFVTQLQVQVLIKHYNIVSATQWKRNKV